ncbi:MAG: aphA [Pedosphaera sp.]|nr:aphA [Pedosphaera sp.]
MGAKTTPTASHKPAGPSEIYLAMNEALLLGSVRQHQLTKAAEGLNAQLLLEIAERVKAEESLRVSEGRFRALVMTGSAVVYRMSPDWSEMRQLDGRNFIADRTKPSGGWLQEYICEADQSKVKAAINEAVRTKAPFELEHRVRRADGTVGWTHSHAVPIRDTEGEIVEWFGTASDITERRRAAEEISQLNLQLEQRVIERTAQLQGANDELDAFSYSVSHDLRAPLRHVMGYAELLQKDDGPQLSEKGIRHLGAICEAGQKMANLIDDLLAFARIGKSELKKSPVNLNQLVREVLADGELDTKERDVVWEILPLPTVLADRALLRQVLVNLISNAIKFTSERPRAEIKIGCAPEGDTETVIFVCDNGAGFNQLYGDKLFEVFQRLHSESEFEGTGIGLANVRRIIQRHGGRTWAEGVMGAGATFYFSIPK